MLRAALRVCAEGSPGFQMLVVRSQNVGFPKPQPLFSFPRLEYLHYLQGHLIFLNVQQDLMTITGPWQAQFNCSISGIRCQDTCGAPGDRWRNESLRVASAGGVNEVSSFHNRHWNLAWLVLTGTMEWIMTFQYFPYIGNNISSQLTFTHSIIFQRGRFLFTTNQLLSVAKLIEIWEICHSEDSEVLGHHCAELPCHVAPWLPWLATAGNGSFDPMRLGVKIQTPNSIHISLISRCCYMKILDIFIWFYMLDLLDVVYLWSSNLLFMFFSEFFYYFPGHGSHLLVVSLFSTAPPTWRISRGRVMNRFKSWGISPKQGGITIQEYSRIVWFRWVWVNTYRYIFSGLFTSINPSYDLGWTKGTRVLTHCMGEAFLGKSMCSTPRQNLTPCWTSVTKNLV